MAVEGLMQRYGIFGYRYHPDVNAKLNGIRSRINRIIAYEVANSDINLFRGSPKTDDAEVVSNYNGVVGKVRKKVHEYLSEWKPCIQYQVTLSPNYSDLKRAFIGEQPYHTARLEFVNNTYYVAPGMVAEYLNDQYIQPYFTFVIPAADLAWYRYCWLTEQEVDLEGAQLWVQEGFDHKDTGNKPLRRWYRKHVKSSAQEHNIPIEEKVSLYEALFQTQSPPKASTPRERRQWLSSASEEIKRILQKQHTNLWKEKEEILF
jgi:hypothetical protein